MQIKIKNRGKKIEFKTKDISIVILFLPAAFMPSLQLTSTNDPDVIDVSDPRFFILIIKKLGKGWGFNYGNNYGGS